ncbi:potassium channel family protein [Streptacidiphilus sp. EB129]|jgi:voltage-gated potassium channel|uniref:potassium channel family protein n=1 Tax=Streptacidiphilus sp. EB129 TaxID=3156262 RepID=UPI0035138934
MELSPRRRARALVGVVVEVVASVSALLVLYALAPLDRPWRDSWLGLAASLAVFAGVVGWQLRGVLRSAMPMLRAARAVAVGVVLFLVIFASLYWSLADSTPGSFNESLDRLDALYFTISVFATVGFGDIAPVSQTARAAVSVQMLLDLAVLGLVVRLVISVARSRMNRPD